MEQGKGVDRRHSKEIADFFFFSQLQAWTYTVDFSICLEILSHACLVHEVKHISSLTDYFVGPIVILIFFYVIKF